jgi:diguanylate cyclase (GGDEF)-like protein/PAS domain S-box-containing protein
MVRLAAAGNAHSSELVASDLHQLSRLHWICSGMLAALILCSVGLIGVISWRNRLLNQAHTNVNALVEDLTNTGQKLTAANELALAAMDEVRSQNLALKARDLDLNTQNARFNAALNNMSQALCMADANQQLIVCNVRFLELFGLSSEQTKPGMPMIDVFNSLAFSGHYETELVRAVCAEHTHLVLARRPGRFLKEIVDGQALSVSHQPMTEGGWVTTYEDVTEHRQAEARIRFMAHHDALTDLPNRLQFHNRMRALLNGNAPGGAQLAVLCLDLDNFKNVNDTLGHPAGDALLQVVAKRLLNCVRENDIVARLGGDEFAILQTAVDQPSQAALLAERIVESLCEPYDLGGHRAIIGVSIGIAITSVCDASPDALLKCADMALYRAKAEGRATFRFFEVGMDVQLSARREMELDLREAVARQELEVFYQPVLNLSDDRLCGFEALLRWRHAALGLVSPAQFIPLAEEMGLIIPIGEWVLQQACQEAARWPEHLKVAVNLSPIQFRSSNLVETVEQALSRSGMAASRLELEITETVLLQNNETVLATLHRLRAIGLSIVLDDFGTGYSSLSYLRSFPFDKLKIDQSFVREMLNRPDCQAIVRSIAELAARLNIRTTAEGVETEEQLKLVRDAGCAEAQGYYFDMPQPPASIRRWLHSVRHCRADDHLDPPIKDTVGPQPRSDHRLVATH